MRLDRLPPFVVLICGYVGPAVDDALRKSHLSGVAVGNMEADVHLHWRRKFWEILS